MVFARLMEKCRSDLRLFASWAPLALMESEEEEENAKAEVEEDGDTA